MVVEAQTVAMQPLTVRVLVVQEGLATILMEVAGAEAVTEAALVLDMVMVVLEQEVKALMVQFVLFGLELQDHFLQQELLTNKKTNYHTKPIFSVGFLFSPLL
jgi:hypothetical protein